MIRLDLSRMSFMLLILAIASLAQGAARDNITRSNNLILTVTSAHFYPVTDGIKQDKIVLTDSASLPIIQFSADYAQDGLLISLENHVLSHGSTASYHIIKDAKGDISNTVTQRRLSEPQIQQANQYSYVYDEMNRIIKMQLLPSQEDRFTFSYDKSNRVKQIDSALLSQAKTQFIYQSNGDLKSIETSLAAPEIKVTHTFIYDDKRQLIKRITVTQNDVDSATEEVSFSEFDSHGNWQKMTVYDGENVRLNGLRTLIYW
jgi:hypothetical protein